MIASNLELHKSLLPGTGKLGLVVVYLIDFCVVVLMVVEKRIGFSVLVGLFTDGGP